MKNWYNGYNGSGKAVIFNQSSGDTSQKGVRLFFFQELEGREAAVTIGQRVPESITRTVKMCRRQSIFRSWRGSNFVTEQE